MKDYYCTENQIEYKRNKEKNLTDGINVAPVCLLLWMFKWITVHLAGAR